MKYSEACSILELYHISPSEITNEVIKKQYKIMALQYHPDKYHGNDANEKFQEIHEAYQFLMQHSDSSVDTISSYTELFSDFFTTIVQDENIISILQRICTHCEERTYDYLENLNFNNLMEIYTHLSKYQHLFHIPNDYMDKFLQIIKTKCDHAICYVLNPNLNDLINAHVYKLEHENETFFVPLWYHQLDYDHNDTDVYVLCKPALDNNTFIDENQNIHKTVTYSLNDIWNTDHINVIIGNHEFLIYKKKLLMKSYQSIIFRGKGMPICNINNMFQCDKKSSIIIHLYISN
jgi:hypothetical protein